MSIRAATKFPQQWFHFIATVAVDQENLVDAIVDQ